ncbi:MAG: GtrA family protein [Polyangia bacterium]|jgi:putative flippase GtrA|nr:GtrA family protein [Polyangia bacterium]
MTSPPSSLLGKILRGKQASTMVQFIRYFIVGGLAFLLDMSVLVMLTELAGMHYLVSAIFGFCAGLTLNYILSITWVFSDRALKSVRAEFLIFALIGVSGLGLNELLLWLGTDLAGLHYTLSKVGATGVVFLFNFAVRKLLLFRK